MSYLNLDDTINKYLDIINDNILEPYLIENVYAKPTKEAKVGMFDDTANVWFFTSSGATVTLNTGANGLIPKYDASNDTTAILKIPQNSSDKDAVIINAVRTTGIASGTKIHNTKLSTNIDSDENGFIYYKNGNNKLYNLEEFKNSNYTTEDLPIANDDYYDFFVRYKILKYIKRTHISAKNNTLRATVITRLGEDTPIVEKGISIITGKKIEKMLDLLQFINNNKFDKFEPLVNCLYYYYWMALVDYNQNYCLAQLAYFDFTSFRSGGDAHTAISKLDGATGFGNSANAMIEQYLITIFEVLCKNTAGANPSKYSSIINNIFTRDTNTKRFITSLLELYGNDNTDITKHLYFAEYDSDLFTSINDITDDVSKSNCIFTIIGLDSESKKAGASADFTDANTATLIDVATKYNTIALFDAAVTGASDMDTVTVSGLYNINIINAFITGGETNGTLETNRSAINDAIPNTTLQKYTIDAIAAYYVTGSTVATIKTAALNAERTLLIDAIPSGLDTKRDILDSGIDFGANAQHILVLNKNNNNNLSYTNFTHNNKIKYNSVLYKLNTLITAFTPGTDTIITDRVEVEPYINKIRELYDFIEKTTFKQILLSDKDSIESDTVFDINDFSFASVTGQLTAIKAELKIILAHYDMAIKLNDIETELHKIPNVIKNSIVSSSTDTDAKQVNMFKEEIKASDVIYKDNVDKYKTKNNELNNIVKSNLYNNIFLYVTIVVLIIICLCIIYINNHKASLKTQYSIMVITFLLLYYIIYTNLTINITEDFAAKTLQDTTLTIISSDIQKDLLKLTNFDKEYKESLKKEKNKYDGFAKSSNSKVNNLEVVLNDEFINAIKSKELVKFLILFTTICIVCFIIQTNLEDLTTTSIIFIILFIVILSIYFYNINLMTRTKHDNKYWNHRMTMK
tara:strand:+ start:1752 stop:4505 length:2754 start_codon:yes stop_codon:yes gene_type:complete